MSTNPSTTLRDSTKNICTKHIGKTRNCGEVEEMSLHCHDMKKGQVYACETCGLEIKILSECTECCNDEDQCGCSFTCCGDDLTLKE